MDHDRYTDQYIAGILAGARAIAMVGASAVTSRPSYFAMKYLLGKGYAVIPVNPAGSLHRLRASFRAGCGQGTG